MLIPGITTAPGWWLRCRRPGCRKRILIRCASLLHCFGCHCISLTHLLAYLPAYLLACLLAQIKVWNSGYPKEPEKGTCTINKTRSAVQNDDADQQTPGATINWPIQSALQCVCSCFCADAPMLGSTSRDMGSEGCVLIKDCDSADEHRQFEVKLFQK